VVVVVAALVVIVVVVITVVVAITVVTVTGVCSFVWPLTLSVKAANFPVHSKHSVAMLAM